MRAAPSRRFDGRASRGRRPRGSRASGPFADVRALAGGDAAAVARLQRSIGNARVGRLLALARCRDGSDPSCGCCGGQGDAELLDEQAAALASAVAARRQLARQPEELPDLPPSRLPPPADRNPAKPPEMTGCSLVWKDGGWYWKCEGLPGVGSTPDVPLDPRDIPGEIEKKLPKGDKKPPLGPLPDRPRGPGPGPDLPPRWFEDACLRDPTSLLCQITKPPPDPSLKPPPAAPPIGSFWSYDVAFEHDLPRAGGAKAARSGMTADGVATLATVVSWLQADPTLQVRLVGHTSSEGTEKDNLALSTRRAKAVRAELDRLGLGARVMDLVGGADPPGCAKIEFGMWACGESQAAQDAARPEDRKVVLTLLRNAPVAWPVPKLRLDQPWAR